MQTRIYDSERNRQSQYKSDKKSSITENVFLNKAKKMVENGIEVSIVGKRVVEALNDGEFYIFTHPNYHPILEKRSANIDEAFKKSSESPLLQHLINQKIEML